MHNLRAGREEGCLRLLLLVLGCKVGATEPRREALSREVMALSVSGKILQSRTVQGRHRILLASVGKLSA